MPRVAIISQQTQVVANVINLAPGYDADPTPPRDVAALLQSGEPDVKAAAENLVAALRKKLWSPPAGFYTVESETAAPGQLYDPETKTFTAPPSGDDVIAG